MTDTSIYIQKIAKRTIDLVFSILTVILFSPILLIISILIKVTSKGPVLIKRKRIGQNQNLFYYYAFRTMRIDASEMIINEAKKITTDPRITSIGKFLRKYSLDEIPSFINIIKGDMSLVGPRPSLLLDLQHLTEQEKKRYNVKPGFTGYWQTYGREKNIQDLKKMAEYDIYYIENWTIWLDIKILLYTVFRSFKAKGAY